MKMHTRQNQWPRCLVKYHHLQNRNHDIMVQTRADIKYTLRIVNRCHIQLATKDQAL